MPRRALVVDDDALTRELIASMLEDLGCETLTARSGNDALAQLATDRNIENFVLRHQHAWAVGGRISPAGARFSS